MKDKKRIPSSKSYRRLILVANNVKVGSEQLGNFRFCYGTDTIFLQYIHPWGGGCNQQSNPDGSPGAGPGGSNGGTPIPYLTFIVGTDHSLLAVWQQYRPIGAVWLRPNGPECRCNVRVSPARLR